MGGKSRVPGPERGKGSPRGPAGKRDTDFLYFLANFHYINGIRIDAAKRQHAQELAEAHDQVANMIDSAILQLKAAKGAPNDLTTKYFGISGTTSQDIATLDTLISEYEMLRKDFGSVTFEIYEDPSRHVYASVRKLTSITDRLVDGGIGDVQVNWANFSKRDTEGRASTLLHEATHVILDKNVWKLPWTEEKYTWDGEFSKFSTEERMKHADTYSDFAMEAARSAFTSTGPGGATSKPKSVTPGTSKGQCMNVASHFDPETGKKSCGNSCVKKKGHAGKHQCVLGHTW